MMTSAEISKPENFTNRELSWLEFNYRVLSERGIRRYRFLSD